MQSLRIVSDTNVDVAHQLILLVLLQVWFTFFMFLKVDGEQLLLCKISSSALYRTQLNFVMFAQNNPTQICICFFDFYPLVEYLIWIFLIIFWIFPLTL